MAFFLEMSGVELLQYSSVKFKLNVTENVPTFVSFLIGAWLMLVIVFLENQGWNDKA